MISAFVLACELFPVKQRTMAGMMGLQYWSVGMVLLSGIAYVTRNWRHLLIITSLPGLLVVPLFWWVPDNNNKKKLIIIIIIIILIIIIIINNLTTTQQVYVCVFICMLCYFSQMLCT